MKSYHTILILAVLSSGYTLTWVLVKLKKMSLMSHRRFWNVVLLISFIVSALLGFLLAFGIDQGLGLKLYKEFLWFHVEFGIAMTVIGMFHAAWHLKYYLNIFKK